MRSPMLFLLAAAMVVIGSSALIYTDNVALAKETQALLHAIEYCTMPLQCTVIVDEAHSGLVVTVRKLELQGQEARYRNETTFISSQSPLFTHEVEQQCIYDDLHACPIWIASENEERHLIVELRAGDPQRFRLGHSTSGSEFDTLTLVSPS